MVKAVSNQQGGGKSARWPQIDKAVMIRDNEGGVSIRSTSPRTVAFFERHAGDPDIVTLAAQILDTVVECVHGCMSAGVGRHETSAVLEYLHGMERRQQLRMEQSMASVSTSLVTNVENAIHASVEKLNVHAISTLVSSAVREWLQAEVDGLKQGQVDLETRLRDVVVHMIAEPQTARHEHLVGMLNSLPTLLARDVTEVCLGKDSDARERLTERLGDLRVRLDEALTVQAREVQANKTAVSFVTDRVQHVIEDVARLCVDSKERIGQVPSLLKAVLNDTFKELEAQSLQVRTLVCSTQQQLIKMERDLCDSLGTLQVLRKGADDVTARVDAIGHQMTVSQVKHANNTRSKGQQGELRLCDLLSERLTTRENYLIDTVNGIAHACDINIRRLGFPDVRVESKAHGEGTGEKVRVKETVRFQSDLLAMNSHGIFVSLFSEIAGKGKIEFEVLPNNKLAVYLSNNNYDVDMIHDVLQLIYRVDSITQAQGGGEGGHVKIAPESMARVQLYLKDFAVKVQTTKTHLKESLSLLNELTFDLIERVLMGSCAPPPSAHPPSMQHCSLCTFACATAGGMGNHKKFKHAGV